MLEFPDNIGELVGEGSIVVSVQMKGGGRVRFQEKRLELYPLDLKMKDAEDFCVSRGGHLASIGSQEDLDEIAEVAGGEFVWLGGTRVRDDWHWVDGRPWGYESWDPESYIGKMPNLDPNFTLRSPKSRKNPGVGGWVSRFKRDLSLSPLNGFLSRNTKRYHVLT